MANRNDRQGNQRQSLIALAVVAGLFALGLILARELYSDSKMEDCLLSGRTNCAPIATPTR